jgi:hypothetical protein
MPETVLLVSGFFFLTQYSLFPNENIPINAKLHLA